VLSTLEAEQAGKQDSFSCISECLLQQKILLKYIATFEDWEKLKGQIHKNYFEVQTAAEFFLVSKNCTNTEILTKRGKNKFQQITKYI
jgi:agmatine/peptidylarginine deiminase